MLLVTPLYRAILWGKFRSVQTISERQNLVRRLRRLKPEKITQSDPPRLPWAEVFLLLGSTADAECIEFLTRTLLTGALANNTSAFLASLNFLKSESTTSLAKSRAALSLLAGKPRLGIFLKYGDFLEWAPREERNAALHTIISEAVQAADIELASSAILAAAFLRDSASKNVVLLVPLLSHQAPQIQSATILALLRGGKIPTIEALTSMAEIVKAHGTLDWGGSSGIGMSQPFLVWWHSGFVSYPLGEANWHSLRISWDFIMALIQSDESLTIAEEQYLRHENAKLSSLAGVAMMYVRHNRRTAMAELMESLAHFERDHRSGILAAAKNLRSRNPSRAREFLDIESPPAAR